MMPKTSKDRAYVSLDRASPFGSTQKKGTKSVACQKCHARKVKCSGGNPCTNCRDSNSDPPNECTYPSRDRQVKLSQQYVDELLRENERLRESHAAPVPASEPRNGSARTGAESQEAVTNPLLEDRPWFLPLSSVDMPIHISEAADAAFATRFRQTLTTASITHLPRMSYVRDERVLLLSDSQLVWPSSARARFLVKVALNTVCRYYHMVRKSLVLETLENSINNGGDDGRLATCKLCALFALGEVYSTKIAASDDAFPGLAYFARARKLVTIPAERPHVDTIEIALLLAIYSYAVNRRHSAHLFASSAVRLSIVMGMNMNIPEHQYHNRLSREHRTRLWWTAYILDRTCSSKLGLPASISDDDILVDLPTNDGLEGSQEDFGDVEYILHNIKLARLSAQSITAIYSRRRHRIPFSQRVQATLKDLTKWMEALPPKLHLNNGGDPAIQPNHIVYLHLTFNQCVILVTRPILLHVLRTHHQSWNDTTIDPNKDLPDSALTLAETCIQCARHSYRLLSEAWIHGSFAIFDYFNTQYLFSAAISLAISSLLGSSQSQSDGDSFNNTVELLKQLAQSGNFGAKEFCQHIDAMVQDMDNVRGASWRGGTQQRLLPLNSEAGFAFAGAAMTAGMALAEPSLQEFLAEPDLNMQPFDNPTFNGLQTPYWPEIWGDSGDGWAAG